MNSFSLKIKGRMFTKGISPSGFTLIELIAVIVILSILATIGTGFVIKTTEAYQRTQTRALLVNTARQALERMTRQLRISLPYSVRTTNGGSCLEFMPIAGGGNYFNPVPDVENDPSGVALLGDISASPAVIDFGSAQYVSIGAMSPDEIYVTGISITRYAGFSGNKLQLNPAKRWQRNSINKRYYLLDNPQAFCVVGNELRFYEGLNINDDDISLTGGSSLIARNIANSEPTDPLFFSLEQGSENRNSRINISLRFSNAGETILFTQGVFIRNVP